MDARLDTALFWASLAFSLTIAFFATVPLNRWLIGHGKGHARVTPSCIPITNDPRAGPPGARAEVPAGPARR
jgi:hypothetical protein